MLKRMRLFFPLKYYWLSFEHKNTDTGVIKTLGAKVQARNVWDAKLTLWMVFRRRWGIRIRHIRQLRQGLSKGSQYFIIEN